MEDKLYNSHISYEFIKCYYNPTYITYENNNLDIIEFDFIINEFIKSSIEKKIIIKIQDQFLIQPLFKTNITIFLIYINSYKVSKKYEKTKNI